MSLSPCTCIGHLTTDHAGLVWVVDVPDPTCKHPLHREDAA